MNETSNTHAPKPLPWHHRAPVLTMALNVALILTIFLTRERWKPWVWDYDLPSNVEWNECRNGRLLGFHDDGRALLIDIANGEETVISEDCKERPLVEFSPDGSSLLISRHFMPGHRPMRTLVVDVATGRVLRDLGALDGLFDHAFSPRGERLFVAPRDGRASIMHLREPAKDMPFSPSVGAPHIARFSPDGTMLVAIIGDERAFLLDARNGKRLRALESDEKIRLANSDPGREADEKDLDGVDSDSWYRRVSSADFLHDGRHVVIVRGVLSDPDGMAQTAYVFNVETGRQVAEMSGHGFWLIQDHRLLTAYSLDYTSIDFLDPVSGKVVGSVPCSLARDAVDPELVCDGYFVLMPVGEPRSCRYRLESVPHGKIVCTSSFEAGWIHAAFTPERDRVLTAEDHAVETEGFERIECILVRDVGSGEVLSTILPEAEHLLQASWPQGFSRVWVLGGDRLRALLQDKIDCVYVRIRPEQWWGVFWLWHFWLIVALSLAVAWSGWRDVRRMGRLEREGGSDQGHG